MSPLGSWRIFGFGAAAAASVARQVRRRCRRSRQRRTGTASQHQHGGSAMAMRFMVFTPPARVHGPKDGNRRTGEPGPAKAAPARHSPGPSLRGGRIRAEARRPRAPKTPPANSAALVGSDAGGTSAPLGEPGAFRCRIHTLVVAARYPRRPRPRYGMRTTSRRPPRLPPSRVDPGRTRSPNYALPPAQ